MKTHSQWSHMKGLATKANETTQGPITVTGKDTITTARFNQIHLWESRDLEYLSRWHLRNTRRCHFFADEDKKMQILNSKMFSLCLLHTISRSVSKWKRLAHHEKAFHRGQHSTLKNPQRFLPAVLTLLWDKNSTYFRSNTLWRLWNTSQYISAFDPRWPPPLRRPSRSEVKGRRRRPTVSNSRLHVYWDSLSGRTWTESAGRTASVCLPLWLPLFLTHTSVCHPHDLLQKTH